MQVNLVSQQMFQKLLSTFPFFRRILSSRGRNFENYCPFLGQSNFKLLDFLNIRTMKTVFRTIFFMYGRLGFSKGNLQSKYFRRLRNIKSRSG